MIYIKIPSRLHVTLISMHNGEYRQNGGIGFAIDDPGLVLEVEPHPHMKLIDERKQGYTDQEIHRIVEILEALGEERGLATSAKIAIQGTVPTHMGFGSSTAVRLGAIEGLLRLNGAEYTREEIIAVSGRGGVSGIGVRTYFDGGFVFDVGRKEMNEFVPSSALEQARKPLPLLCKQLTMPDWPIGICIPDIAPKSEAEEKAFFRRTCPIDPHASYETLYHVLYGVTSAVIEEDIEMFGRAINAIQRTEWKQAERKLYGGALDDVEQVLYDCGASAVGMSSLGPSLYFVGEDMEAIVQCARRKQPASNIFATTPAASGRIIT